MSQLGTSTLGELTTEVYHLVGCEENAARTQRIHASLNRHYASQVRRGNWPSLNRTDTVGLRKSGASDPSVLEASDALAPLPFGCRDVKSITIGTIGQTLKQLEPDKLLATAGSSYAVTGCPRFYCVSGETAQYAALAADSTLKVEGDAGNDDINTVRVWFRRNDGHQGHVAMEEFSGSFSTGITSTGTAELGWPIERVQADDGWVGTLTIKDSSDNVLVEIHPDMVQAGNARPVNHTRLLIRVWPVPDADYAALVSWRRTPSKLVKNGDVLEIPIASALVHAAAGDILRQEKEYSAAAVESRIASGEANRAQSREDVPQTTVSPYPGNVVDGNGVW